MACGQFYLSIIFLGLLPLLAYSQEDAEDPIVTTLTGSLSGQKQETSAGTKYYTFLGIPYAEAPVGKLRFRDPVAKTPWDGVLNATDFSKECLQKTFSPDLDTPTTLVGSEDCLYLNIATPSLPKPSYNIPRSLKPVMFWIHGGGFTIGEGKLDPSFLLDEDVLVVSVNYRLGPFGFLALEGNSELAGNIGLKDQQEALQWVNKNIAFFGGDPARVTLFGESAGAISVHAHVLSPRIKNIFQGAILQSGTALMKFVPIFMEKEVQKSSQKFLEKVNCSVPEIIACLQAKDVETLMELPPESDDGNAFLREESTFWIVQDSVSQSPVLPYNPLQQLTVGNVKKVPMITGMTKDDGGLILIIDQSVKNTFEEDNSTELMKTMGLFLENINENDVDIIDVMKRFYFSEGSYEDNENNLMEMQTDAWFGSPSAEVLKLHSKVAPVFPYVLNERCTELSWSSLFGGGDKDYGVAHADDLNCIFTPFPPFGSLTESGSMVSQAMVKSWTNFAKFENPSPYLSSEPHWSNGEIMFFEAESGLKKNSTQLADLEARMLLWDKLWWEPLEEKVNPPVQRQRPSILTFIRPYNWFHTHLTNQIYS